MKRKKTVITFCSIIVALVGIQFVPVNRTNPAIAQDIGAPPAVATVLKRSCYDCHSNETRWPWYAKVAPASFLISHHVEDARQTLNFSDWGRYTHDERVALMQESLDEIRAGKMPMPNYVWLHEEAKLTDSDRKLLSDWINAKYRTKKAIEHSGLKDL